MAVDAGSCGQIFAGLAQGDGAGFFAHVADDVDWTVMGTHPLAGPYMSKADFVAGTFAKLARCCRTGRSCMSTA
jgi:ketosteroid isomerase-like protein